MATAQVRPGATVGDLMAEVKRLSAAELRDFTERLAQWRDQNSGQAEPETVLLARIAENSRMSTAKQRRFNRLRRRHQAESLTKAEQEELQTFWRRVEQMNAPGSPYPDGKTTQD